ncbi:MAG: phosphonate ABC transporter, permease protein PhnE [Alphaproteobacteria bacterium]
MTATPNAARPDPTHAAAVTSEADAKGGLPILPVTLLILGLFAWSWWSLDVQVVKVEGAAKRLAQFFSGLVPPDLTVMETVLRSTVETLQIAYVATVLSALLSLGAGLLAAANLTPAWVHQPVKWVLGVMRGIPLILVALVFVVTIGFGALAGVLAITFHATGMLGKFYAEALENADPRPLEALESVGASWAQRVRFGALAQVAPDLVRDTLFRFELNFRESLVLGLVGAGGVGFYIQLYARAFQYEKVATLTLVVLLMVVLIEQLSTWCRRRLR